MSWIYLEVSVMFAFSVQLRDRGRASQQRGCDMIWEELRLSFSTPNPMIHRNTVRARMRGLERDKKTSKITQWFFHFPKYLKLKEMLDLYQTTQNISQAERDNLLISRAVPKCASSSVSRLSISVFLNRSNLHPSNLKMLNVNHHFAAFNMPT